MAIGRGYHVTYGDRFAAAWDRRSSGCLVPACAGTCQSLRPYHVISSDVLEHSRTVCHLCVVAVSGGKAM